MKFIKSLPIILGLTTTIGCSENINRINLLIPTGAPAVAFYNFENDSHYSLETNSVPNQIVAAMSGGGDTNAVVLPTNAGIQAIKAGANYKIASTITFGNFFVCATGHDQNKVLDKGDIVVLFQQNQIPDKLFQDVYSTIFPDLTIKYAQAASNAAGVLKTGSFIDEGSTIEVDYVLVADPSMRAALAGNPNASIYSNVRTLFQEKHSSMDLMQASLFVKSDLDSTTVNSLLNKFNNDINKGLGNPDLVKQGMDKKGTEQEVSAFYGVNSALVLSSLKDNNGIGLGFKNAFENKASIDNFLSIIAPQIGVTDEKIYYK